MAGAGASSHGRRWGSASNPPLALDFAFQMRVLSRQLVEFRADRSIHLSGSDAGETF